MNPPRSELFTGGVCLWRLSKRADTSMVFTIAVIVFALSFLAARRIQGKFGPLI